MVHLILSSTKGNQGLRYFPYTGYLGLTPIRVEGVVRTKLDADGKLLHAKSLAISIRCYESRVGRVNTLQSKILVDYTQVLWSKPAGVDYEQVGNLEYPFRFTIPAKVAGFSTAVFVDYRCMWRVEAVLTHIPISGVGSRQIKHFELPLIRYSLPPLPPRPPTLEQPLSQQTDKARAPRIRYTINSPKSYIGPLDLVSIPIQLLPVDPDVSIRSASVIVERRLQFLDTTNSLPSSPSAPDYTTPRASSSATPSRSASTLFSYSPSQSFQEPSHVADGLASTSSLSSSNPTITPGTVYPSSSAELHRLLPPSPTTPTLDIPPSPHSQHSASSKVVVNPIAGAESSGQFARDANGVWNKTLTLQWPASKTHSRWGVGETIHSDLVSVKFFIRAKIIVSSPSGTESIELAEKEILVASTNDAERQLALSKYNDMILLQDLLPSTPKTKSQRRSRAEGSPQTRSYPSTGSSEPEAPKSLKVPTLPIKFMSPRPKSAPRRPHTSAGPRDKAPYHSLGTGYDRPQAAHSSGDEASHKRRPDKNARTRPGTGTSQPEGKKGFFFTSMAPRLGTEPSGSSTSTTASSSSISSSSQTEEESDQMREWEEELARIEMRSRRSSDLLGFSGKRKRSLGVPKVVLPGEEEV